MEAPWAKLRAYTDESAYRQKYAVKVLKPRPASAEGALFQAEANLLRQLAHPCVIAFEEIFGNPGKICIVMEYCPQGDLRCLIGDLANQK